MANRGNNYLVLLPAILLFFLPILVLNRGIRALLEKQYQNQIAAQRAVAEKKLNGISFSWEFSHQLTAFGGRFRGSLQDLYRSSKSVKPAVLAELGRKIFRRPFPEHLLWVMKFDPTDVNKVPEVALSPKNYSGAKRPYCLAIRHLVRNALGIKELRYEFKSGEKMIGALFGKNVQSRILFQDLIGRPCSILHKNRQFNLLWDFVKDSHGKPVAGFFLLVPNDRAAQVAGFKLALKNSGSDFPVGFLQFHPSSMKNFLHGPWNECPAAELWVRDLKRNFSLYKLENSSGRLLTFPLRTHTVFLKLLPECTHLGVTLMPNVAFPKEIAILSILNLFLFLFFVSLFLNGFMFGRWPEFRVQTRFLLLYALVAAFPLISSVFLARVAFQEKKESMLLSLQREVEGELISIDLGKDRMQLNMKRAFSQAHRNPEFQKTLREKGLSDKKIFNLVLEPFRQFGASFPLPLTVLYDYEGNAAAELGSFDDRSEVAGYIRFLRAAIVRILWSGRKVPQIGSGTIPCPLSQEDQILLDVWEGASGIKVKKFFSEFRGKLGSLSVGHRSFSKIHELFSVGGEEKYALVIIWQNEKFSPLILKDSLEAFSLNPKFRSGKFIAYKRERGTLEPLLSEDKSHEFIRKQVSILGNRAGSVFNHSESEKILTGVMTSRRNTDEVYGCSVSTERIFAEIEALFWRILGIFVIWAISMTIVLTLTVKRIVFPIQELTEALKDISTGNLDRRLRLNRNDELGEISDTFETMVEGLKKRRRISTMVSQKARADLFSGAEDEKTDIEPYRTDAVTLVSDIRSFTTICESQPTQSVTSLLNKHFKVMAAVISRHQGGVDKFIGDAIQAIFQELPNCDRSASCRAVKAGVEMLKEMEKINQERANQGIFPYFIGVGIEKGIVTIGGFGDSRLRFDYSVMGTPMKKAAFLEGLSKKASYLPLVVSPRIAEAVRSSFPNLRPLGGHEEEAFVFPEGELGEKV